MDDFATRFEALFRLTYVTAVRRVRDKRERLSPETVAFLDHLAAAGPMTLGEMAKHMDRAASTLSEMVDHLEVKGFLTRDRDPADGRRSLVWLTPEGQGALIDARNVLDAGMLARAGSAMAPGDREALLNAFENFTRNLKGQRP